MKIFKFLTLFLLGFAFYFPFAGSLDQSVFHFAFKGGTSFTLNVSHLIIIGGILLLFFELLKASVLQRTNAIESSLSMLASVVYLLLFILFRPATTPTFLILTLLSFTESFGGFIISITAARRDISFSR